MMGTRSNNRGDEWRLHAKNIVSQGIISARRDAKSGKFVYKSGGEIFSEFNSAVIATEEFGNHKMSMIAIQTFWKTSNEAPFFLYSPKGILLGKCATLAEMSNLSAKFEKAYPPISEDKAERRKRAFIENKRLIQHRKKRAMIERAKQEILAERAAAARRAKDMKIVGDKEGSW